MTVPANTNALLLRSAAPATYQISRSLRFNSADTPSLTRTPGSAGNRKTFTWSGWVKRSAITSTRYTLFAAGSSGSAETEFFFQQVTGADTLTFYHYPASYQGQCATNAVFRDTSAWYHIVLAVDTTQATASNRCKIYVNGVQQDTTFTTNFTQNADLYINSTVSHGIGYSPTESYPFSGYLADIYFLDGTATTPSTFAETDAITGQWVPKTPTGISYGTNGFRLPFSDNSGTTSTTLGKDSAGSNNWTPNNLSIGFPVTQNYSTTTTGTAPTPFLSTSYYALAFDGDTSTGFAWNTGTWAMNWTSLPSAVTVSSTLRIFCYPRLGTLTVNINGSNVASITGNTADWRTISFTGTINTISFNGTDLYASVYAIEVNGAILIDPRANSGNDSLVDTPTSYGTDLGTGGEVRGNYCTANPLAIGGGTLSNGNLDYVRVSDPSGNTSGKVLTTIATNTGKWYFEYTVATSSTSAAAIGITSNIQGTASTLGGTNYVGMASYEYVWRALGQTINNASYASYGTAASNGDVVMCAFDVGAGKIWFGRNGTWFNSSSPSAGTSPAFSGFTETVMPIFGIGTASGGYDANGSINFGQRPFAYTAPSGFKALVDTNLTAPVIAKPNEVMDVVLYTGTGASRSITGLNFSPDLVWTKGRSNADNNSLYDVIRGTGKELVSESTVAEGTYGNTLTSFDSTGFSLGSASWMNGSGKSYVAWTWDAGASTVTNTAGSITSSVRANATAGFSVVTYTGTGSAATVGHGLGAAPSLIITKSRNNAYDWTVYHSSLGINQYLFLNSTAASTTNTGYWNTAPTSTIFGVGNNNTGSSGSNLVAYCFAPVAGYSAMGSYTGNGSADGPFVYTGHRTRFLLYKRSDVANDWYIMDTARDTYNVSGTRLFPNLSNAEFTYTSTDLIDVTANGFKIRSSNAAINANGGTYIYMALAENPFQYARAR